ncbi:hypothetical protein [Coleofasciculus sp.]|uniref:hypothetical protein n=1 Tax=Coleofasciculus sp. TaxID=3100458 RepID=UPI0040632EB7
MPSVSTFIGAFSAPSPGENSSTSQSHSSSHAQESGDSNESVTYRAVGVPSRVFPGLGLRWVPVNSSID